MKHLLSFLVLFSFATTVAAFECNGPRELLFLRDQVVMSEGGKQTRTDVYTIRADGRGEKRITRGALTRPGHDNNDAAWSPDGREIVFVSTRNNKDHTEIYRVRAGGSKPQRLTDNEHDDEYPDWSAEGGIVFSSNRDGRDFQLYRMNGEGQQVQRLAESKNKDFDARWSPKGDAVAFTREHNGVYRIFLSRDGGPAQPMTPNWFKASEPTWTPDGESLVFSTDGYNPGSGRTELFIMLAKDGDGDGLGDNLQRLTETPGNVDNMEPEISADNRCILFVRTDQREPDKSSVYVMPRQGGDAIRITDGFGPRWRP